MRLTRHLAVLCLLAAAPPAAAELGFFGWGPRLGVGDDPDQVLIGLTQDFGELVDRLRLQPSLEVGVGDDHTIVSGVVPVHYRFTAGGGAVPYLGGGVLLAWIDRDLPPQARGRDDSEFDIAPVLVGGVEWPAGRRGDAFLELQVPGGDAHDAKLVLGYLFRRR